MVVGPIPEYLYDISRAGEKSLHEMPIGHRISRHTQFSFVFGGVGGRRVGGRETWTDRKSHADNGNYWWIA
jgi:hypothetical protein